MARPADPAAPATPPALAPDSLACSLWLGAQAVAAVLGGRSLDAGLALFANGPATARAAAQDAAYGALRRYGAGDFILGRLLQTPLSQAEVRALLLVSLYRLETWPEAPHTVVDQAVSAAGAFAGGAFRGLVNGVLRNYLRQREDLLRAAAADPVATHWHPDWWLARLQRAYPEAWPQIIAAGNSAPPMCLRVNRRRTTRAEYEQRLAEAGIAARPVAEDGLLLERPMPVDAVPGFAEGLVSVQDAGAQRAAELLAPAAGARVLDVCSAPGGKTAHLLERQSLDLLALDVQPARLRRVGETLARLGLTAKTHLADASQAVVDQSGTPAPAGWWDGVPFDAILVDAPCSASGVVRRHPDAKWLRRAGDLRGFVHTQAAILDVVWPLLAVGGKLLYATCSIFPEENGAQIDAFVCRHGDAERVAEERLLPQAEHDGFYYALLRKTA
ncbi:16S rRNA (cytosine(967)-C(5))-methyltransferase RsmB [Rhodocyclus gracilis]|uniref:16S rRNA (cytosine(967)-C(5))-methyltransferase n=1 Tax=Rhodocyclus tenuis TaxID=1066 RepID=A0A6L5JZX2_RHOTE|nr:16S rRNA (cytosine(967)-C(5))-methyltransferase RsmB [Rhodocyclus gracilis]